jgi:hypothetical protein
MLTGMHKEMLGGLGDRQIAGQRARIEQLEPTGRVVSQFEN